MLLSAIVVPSAVVASPVLPAGAAAAISSGLIHVEPAWLPPPLCKALRVDADNLFRQGLFSADGLTNTAKKYAEQGFSARADRQTFKGDGWMSDAGDTAARAAFAARMSQLRNELAASLLRPTLADEGVRKHEMTYNWYEPGAALGRHLDEHHEETKGVKGWRMPTRRSVTWLVYLNEAWQPREGGALRTFPRASPSAAAVGADAQGNLQVGWLDQTAPVFLDSWRADGQSALVSAAGKVLSALVSPPTPLAHPDPTPPLSAEAPPHPRHQVLSARDFDVPRQPIDFGAFLRPELRPRFEQTSTSRLDPRFAAGGGGGGAASGSGSGGAATPASGAVQEFDELHHVDVLPAAGTLVLFDSVSLPHLVRPVTGRRQRIAATGWFHEDLQQLALLG